MASDRSSSTVNAAAVTEPTPNHVILFFYKEALQWLQLVARECQKTANVDLQKLLHASEKCAEVIRQLQEIESSSMRLAALEQLSCSLDHHRNIFKEKETQLEGATPFTANSHGHASRLTPSWAATVSSTHHINRPKEEDEQSKRRFCAIEDTIIEYGGALSFSSVAGLYQAKQALREAIILPVKYPHLFTDGCSPWKRILLYGPPGTGKTLLAQAIGGEINATFYCVSSSDLISSWVGESEKLIKDLFSHARKRINKAVIFIDEVDSICRQRHSKEEEHTRRVKTELLRQMEGVDVQKPDNSNNMFLLCATNCPWELDPAFLRRFQRRIYIPLPDRAARQKIMEQHFYSTPITFSEDDWDTILTKTEGYSGSDLAVCVADALLEPVRELDKATHWKVTMKQKGCGDDSLQKVYTPCKQGEQGAGEYALEDLPPIQVYPRNLNAFDVIKAISRSGQTVMKEDIDKYSEFTHKFGQIG